MSDSAPPYDLTAERQVIGNMVVHSSCIPVLMSEVGESDFFRQQNGWVFAACCDLFMSDKPVNTETVLRRLGEMRLPTGKTPLEVMGGPEVLMEAVHDVSYDELEYWTDRVRRKSMERQALEIVNRARRQLSSNPDDVASVISEAERELADVGRDRNLHTGTISVRESAEVVKAKLDEYLSDPNSIAGFATEQLRSWDKAVDGFRPGATYIFYAPSSRFKSLFTQNLGWMLAQENIPGLWFTTEMTHKEVTERIVGFESGINMLWTRRDQTIGDYRARINGAIQRVSVYPLYICDRSVSMNMIRSEVMRRVRWDGIKYVIIDLVNQVSIDSYKDNSVAQQEAIMKAMKELAKDADVPIIMVAHVAKGERTIAKKAVLDVEEMKGSSALYQDVDVAVSLMPVKRNVDPDIQGEWVGLNRDELKNLQSQRAGGKVTMMAAITKNRHGTMEDLLFTVDFERGGRISEFDATQYFQKSFQ